jgi:hypothetical protein
MPTPAERVHTAQQIAAEAEIAEIVAEATASFSAELVTLRPQLAAAAAEAARLAGVANHQAELIEQLRAQLAELSQPDPLRFVDAHDMTSVDRGLNVAGDYWVKNYRPANGEGGAHVEYGGWTRDNPLPRGSFYTGAANWRADGERARAADAASEIAWAKAAGIGGFFSNLMSPPGSQNHDRAISMAHAAAADGNFFATPNLDCNSSSLAALTVAQTADMLAQLYAIGAARKIGGRWLLGSFFAEKRTPAWWSNLKTELERRGYPVELMLVFLNASTNNMDAYADVAWGYSVWGPAVPRNVASLRAKADHAHKLGKKWMSPVRPQDTRPKAGVAAEAENTTLWRSLWAAANDHGDCVQVITWDDFAEHSHIEPSEGGGFAWTTLTRLYGDAFRHRQPVHTDRDIVVLTHRTHPHAAKPTSGQTKLMNFTLDGGGTPRDTTEALCILAQPAQVSVNGGPAVAVPAQTPTAVTVPLRVGYQEVVWADQRMSSPHRVVAAPVVQDLHYKAAVNA